MTQRHLHLWGLPHRWMKTLELSDPRVNSLFLFHGSVLVSSHSYSCILNDLKCKLIILQLWAPELQNQGLCVIWMRLASTGRRLGGTVWGGFGGWSCGKKCHTGEAGFAISEDWSHHQCDLLPCGLLVKMWDLGCSSGITGSKPRCKLPWSWCFI